MPSPFPGIDPFLEKPSDWHDFHQDFLIRIRSLLVPQIRPGYIAKTDDHVFLHELSAEERIEARRVLGGVGDVVVKRNPAGSGSRTGAAVAAPPTASRRLPECGVEEVRVPFLTVQDRDTRAVVTVIELLSPANKRPGGDRDAYLGKRARLLEGGVNLVEIDLLRGGPPTPLEAPPPGDFRVVVSRRADVPPDTIVPRPPADVWVWDLRDPLPVVPVPLRPPDADAVLDLRAAMDRTFEEAGLLDSLYLAPPDPPLPPADAAWAAGVLTGAGFGLPAGFPLPPAAGDTGEERIEPKPAA